MKFFQDWCSRVFTPYKELKKQALRAERWKRESRYWRSKYDNAKKYIDDIHDDIHSYE